MDKRTKNIISAYQGGLTSEEIGCAEGVTGQRIRQILKAAGLSYRNSPAHQLALSRSAAEQAMRIQKREARCLKSYGCDWHTFKAVTGSNSLTRGSRIASAFWAHKNNARRFRNEWKLSLPEYAEIVGPHLDAIGRGRMTLVRRDKRGPYSKANCTIMSQRENSALTNGFKTGRDRQHDRSEERRKQAMELVKQGFTQREIAQRMKLSHVTIASYVLRTKNGQR